MTSACDDDLNTVEYWPTTHWRDHNAHVEDWRRSDAYQRRPFRFEDLGGAPEPAHWGPVYPKTASASVEKWRRVGKSRALSADEARQYGAAVHAWIRSLSAIKPMQGLNPKSICASGQAGEYDRDKYKAAMLARLNASVEADRRRQLSEPEIRNMRLAYAEGMAAKRARLARGPVAVVSPEIADAFSMRDLPNVRVEAPEAASARALEEAA